MPSPLLVRRDGSIDWVTLNRPDVRNALDDELVSALAEWAALAARDAELRAAVLSGAGKVFCAGADLAWMGRAIDRSHDENVREARETAEMFERLNSLPVPLIGRVHTAALGGGAGLAAVCDVVIADEDAIFGFPEVKLGILPAVIAPYVLAKIGTSAARELFLTGTRFPATRALAVGLAHRVVPATALDSAVRACLDEILSAGPEAIAAAKSLLREIAGHRSGEVIALTADAIARRRASPEGQEGMRAFLEKRRPRWQSPGE